MDTLDLYHRTSMEHALPVFLNGMWKSLEQGEVCFSTHIAGYAEDYGDTVIHVRVPFEIAVLDDEFETGERHFRVKAGDLQHEHVLAIMRREPREDREPRADDLISIMLKVGDEEPTLVVAARREDVIKAGDTNTRRAMAGLLRRAAQEAEGDRERTLGL